MTMAKPVWFDYIEWDFSEPSFPRNVGFAIGFPADAAGAEKKLVEYRSNAIYRG